MTIYMDSARSPNSKRTAGEIERLELRRMSHPRSRLDISRDISFDVYRKWIRRLHALIRTEGEYGSEWHEQFLMP
jgi:hypothetical protein